MSGPDRYAIYIFDYGAPTDLMPWLIPTASPPQVGRPNEVGDPAPSRRRRAGLTVAEARNAVTWRNKEG